MSYEVQTWDEDNHFAQKAWAVPIPRVLIYGSLLQLLLVAENQD